MRFLLLLALAWSWVTNAVRTLPADVQFELLFPRNETYAPTQLFPIVFGVSNLDAVWPLAFYLTLTVGSNDHFSNESDNLSWQFQNVGHGSSDLVETAPGKHFFYVPRVNMTNGTTDSFTIGWTVTIIRRCFTNETNPTALVGSWTRGWANTVPPSTILPRIVEFSTAPGGQRPDIESVLNSCPVSDEENTAAIRITEILRDSQTGKDCPVFDTNIPFDNCAFKSSAKELAANVSAAMLDEMRCTDGEWQTITAPCPKKNNMGLLQSPSVGMGWILLVLVFSALSVL